MSRKTNRSKLFESLPPESRRLETELLKIEVVRNIFLNLKYFYIETDWSLIRRVYFRLGAFYPAAFTESEADNLDDLPTQKTNYIRILKDTLNEDTKV